MRLIRARQLVQLLRPTARAIVWGPLVGAAVLASLYVWREAPAEYIEHRILLLRISALLICMGAAFVLDDPTEETIGHVPTPLLLRRSLRVALILPLVGAAWAALLHLVGDVPVHKGGPIPVGDVTMEAITILVIALCAASLGARFTSDRTGGIAAAPIVLTLVGVALFLPYKYKPIIGSASDPRWAEVHDAWRVALLGAVLLFVALNTSLGPRRVMARLGVLRPAVRS